MGATSQGLDQEFQRCVARYRGSRIWKLCLVGRQALVMAFVQLICWACVDIPACLDSVDGKCCTTWTRTSMARAKPTNAQRITRLERLSIFGPTTDVYRGCSAGKVVD